MQAFFCAVIPVQVGSRVSIVSYPEARNFCDVGTMDLDSSIRLLCILGNKNYPTRISSLLKFDFDFNLHITNDL